MLYRERFSEVLVLFEIWFSWLPDFPCDIDDCLFDLIGRFSLLPMSCPRWLEPEVFCCYFYKALI